MKRWRVGTLSMGLSLVLVGITLLMSTWSDSAAFDTLIAWWPVIFIMLGLEIILYLVLRSKDQPIIHYDMMSILFVSFLCCMCIGFSLVTASGLAKEIRYSLGSEDRTFDIPAIEEAVPATVDRIVIQSNGAMPKIDMNSTARALHLFGNYRIRQSLQEAEASSMLAADDFATIRTVDRTMYVSIKELPVRTGLNSYYPYATLTMTLPQDVPYELRGRNNQVVPLQ
jgi:hypothetical protein